VGAAVGAAVGAIVVGAGVGGAVGAAVGAGVGAAVGAAVGVEDLLVQALLSAHIFSILWMSPQPDQYLLKPALAPRSCATSLFAPLADISQIIWRLRRLPRRLLSFFLAVAIVANGPVTVFRLMLATQYFLPFSFLDHFLGHFFFLPLARATAHRFEVSGP